MAIQFRKPYISHLHTSFADGEMSVENYFSFARDHGYKELIFLEHVRMKPSYDVSEFVAQIRDCSSRYNIRGRVGFEAALLKSGQLDISSEALKYADVLGIAVHRFSNNLEQFLLAFSKVLRMYPDKVKVWVHPGLYLKKRKMLDEKALLYIKMLKIAVNEGCLIERNLKYGLIPQKLCKIIPQKKLIVGVDSHTNKDLLVRSE